MNLPTKILVATDFSSCGERASEVALEWAARRGAELHWAHGVEHLPDVTPPSSEPLLASYVQQARRLGTQKLGRWAERAREKGLVAETHVVGAPVARGVIDLAARIGCDWIVVGTHGYTGLRHVLLGSVAEQIAREAPCSVLVVRGERSPLQPDVIVLGDDLTIEAQPVRDVAGALSRELGVRLDVVHALDFSLPYFASMDLPIPVEVFEQSRQEVLRKLETCHSGGDVDYTVVRNRPCDAVCDRAAQISAGLIVVGSHVRRGLERVLLGSSAAKILRHAPCSVLVVR